MRKLLAVVMTVALLLAPVMGPAGAAHASAGADCHTAAQAKDVVTAVASSDRGHGQSVSAELSDAGDGGGVVGGGECCIAGCAYVSPEIHRVDAPPVPTIVHPDAIFGGLAGRLLPVEVPPPRTTS